MKVRKGVVKDCWVALKQIFLSEDDTDLIPGGQEKQQNNFCSAAAKIHLSAYLGFMAQLGYHQTLYTLTLGKLLHCLLEVKLTNKTTVPHYSIY